MISFSPLHQSTSRIRILVLTLATLCLAVPGSLAAEPVAVLGAYANITTHKRFPTGEETAPPVKAAVKISAKSAIIYDPIRNATIFAKAPDDPRQPASTIKILTGMIALQTLDGQEQVRISHEAAERPSSKMYLDPEKSYLADDLINGVLLASANDASVALAEHIAGSETAFAEKMTLQAIRWGATNTVCKTATGLTAEGQTSTARDLALIFSQAMLNGKFSARMKERAMQTQEGEKFYNHNKALWQISGAEGGKTGYTRAARQTYVGKFKRGEAEIVVALMGSETMWNDLKHLVQYGFSQFQYLSTTDRATDDNGQLIASSAASSTVSVTAP